MCLLGYVTEHRALATGGGGGREMANAAATGHTHHLTPFTLGRAAFPRADRADGALAPAAAAFGIGPSVRASVLASFSAHVRRLPLVASGNSALDCERFIKSTFCPSLTFISPNFPTWHCSFWGSLSVTADVRSNVLASFAAHVRKLPLVASGNSALHTEEL